MQPPGKVKVGFGADRVDTAARASRRAYSSAA